MAATGKSIYTALMDARKAMGPLIKDSTNPHFKNKYASLENVVDVIDGPLRDAGIDWVQYFDTRDDGVMTLNTMFTTTDGGMIRSVMPVTCKDPGNPQAVAGAITYYRRYALITMCGLTPEDDDGNTAARPEDPKPQTRKSSKSSIELVDFTAAVRDAAKAGDFGALSDLADLAYDQEDPMAVAVLIRHHPNKAKAVEIGKRAKALGIDTTQATEAYAQRED